MRPKTLSLIVLLTYFLTACAPQAATRIPLPLPATEAVVEHPAPTSLVPTPHSDGPAAGWTEYRDARYGYALTLPCYWVVTPTPAGGILAAMTARSYTDQFHAAHSVRGEWAGNAWPTGAYKLDIVVFEGIDPALSMQDAIRYVYATYSPDQAIVSAQEATFGRNQAYFVTVTSGQQAGDTQRIVQFPLGPGKLASVVFQPSSALDSPDVQAILGSFALTAGEVMTYPLQSPAGPPDGGSPTCQ